MERIISIRKLKIMALDADKWAENHPKKETDVDELRAKLKELRAKK